MQPLTNHTVKLIIFLLIIGSSISLYSQPDDGNWPSFRGKNAHGTTAGHSTPTEWDVESGKNINWKIDLPGLGHSSPVIWGNRIFITSAISGMDSTELKVGLYGDIASVNDSTEHRFMVYAIDKKSGKIIWEKTAYTGIPKVKRHTKASHANSTPATDGKHLVAFFGSEGLYCYDMNGNLLWKKDLGLLDSGFFMVPEAQWGFASSPIIHNNMVIIQCDVQKNSYLAALDIKTGKEVWKTSRKEVPTWSSPAIYRNGNSTQIIVNGFLHIGGYDAKTGKEVWKMRGGGDIPVPTPIIADNRAYITNAHGWMSPVYAVNLASASGDISADDISDNEHLAWGITKGGAYMQTPLLYDSLLYVCRDNGVLSAYQADTGERIYQQRLAGGKTGFSASSVAADGKLYLTSEAGDIFVIRTGKNFELLAENDMGDICMATPAISEGALFFRTRYHLVSVKNK